MTARDPRADGMARDVGVVGLCVMGSRVLGLVREMVLAYFLKAEYGLDAFYAAFRIPNLLRDLFGEGVLSKAFVSVFAEAEERGGDLRAWRLANRVVSATVVVVGGLVVLGIVIAPWIVALMVPGRGFDLSLPESTAVGIETKRELTVLLTRMMFPFLLTVSLASVFMGMLNARGRFAVPASASMFFNAGSVVFGVIGVLIAPRYGRHPAVGMAAGVVIGGVLQWLVQVPSARRAGYRYQWDLDFRDRDLRKVGTLIAPFVVGVAAVQVNVFVNSIFASLGEGWLTWISQAFRVMHLPIGVFGVAVSTVALPAMARAWARGAVEEYKACLHRGLGLVLSMTIPAAFGLAALDVPIIRLIFERGRFTPTDTIQTAGALSCYAVGLAGYASVKVITDAFYARKETTTPVRVSLVAIAMNIGLNALLVLVFDLGHRGLALSTACSLTLNALVLLGLLRRRVGAIGGRSLAGLCGRLVAASVPMALSARWVAATWERGVGVAGTLDRVGQVGASMAMGLAVLGAMGLLLRIVELREAIRAFAAPFRGAR